MLKVLEPSIRSEERKAYAGITKSVAEPMGHLTMVRYKYELGGEYVTPRNM